MRHTFLIIAHNEPYILKILLEKLRGISGDIFVHLDKKVRGEQLEELTGVIISGAKCCLNVLTSVGAISRK